MLQSASGAQAMKDAKEKLDDIVRSIKAELESVELDVKAPKQLKERIRSLLDKVAKIKLKVQKSPLICKPSSIKSGYLASCNNVEKSLMLDMHPCVRAAPPDC